MVLPFFEEMRWANADWYTASPLEQMSDEKLAKLAKDADMTIEELRTHFPGDTQTAISPGDPRSNPGTYGAETHADTCCQQ